MDTIILDKKSIRLKGKNASILLDPTSSMQKTETDGVVFLSKGSEISASKVEGSRIEIKGPGEYEVGGVKVSTARVNGGLLAKVDLDNIKILTGSGAAIEKFQDKIDECQIAVVNADSVFNYSVLTAIEPSVLIVYGENKAEVQKSLGKEDVQKVSKFSITADKLPEEMQFVILE